MKMGQRYIFNCWSRRGRRRLQPDPGTSLRHEETTCSRLSLFYLWLKPYASSCCCEFRLCLSLHVCVYVPPLLHTLEQILCLGCVLVAAHILTCIYETKNRKNNRIPAFINILRIYVLERC